MWWQRIMDSIGSLFGRKRQAVGFVWYVRLPKSSLVAHGGYLMLLLTNAQKVHLSVSPVDQYGNPARVDGIPTWNNSDPSVGTLTPAADGMSADFVTLGPVGLTQVSVSGDADLGSGVRPISATLDIQVEPSEAVAMAINAGVPEPR